MWLALAGQDDMLLAIAAVLSALAGAVSAADDLAIDMELRDILDDGLDGW